MADDQMGSSPDQGSGSPRPAKPKSVNPKNPNYSRPGKPSAKRNGDKTGKPSFKRSDDRPFGPSSRNSDDRPGKPSYRKSDDKPYSDRTTDRPGKPSYRKSDDKLFSDRSSDRPGKPSFRKSEDKPFSDRSSDRPGKPSYRKSEDNPFSDRSTDRPGKPSYRKSDDKPFSDRSTDRPGKPSYRKSEDKPFSDRSTDRPGKPSYRKSDDKPYSDRSTDRPGKPSFKRADGHPGSKDAPTRPSSPFNKKDAWQDRPDNGDSAHSDSADTPNQSLPAHDKPKRAPYKKPFDTSAKSADTRPFRKRVAPSVTPEPTDLPEAEPDKKNSFSKKLNNAFHGIDKKDDKRVITKVEREQFEDKVYGELKDPDTSDRLKKTYRKPAAKEAATAKSATGKSGRTKAAPLSPDKEMPLNKFIAHSGEASRRDAAEWVRQGKVKVNGELVVDPGYKVQPEDKVTMGGKKLTPTKGFVYLLLNKPKGFITTNDDPQGRRTVLDLVANAGVGRLYPVGRLDRDTTGLLLLTNDGDLTQKLSHPSFEIKKVYHVTLDKPLTKADFDKVFEGVELEDGKAHVDALAFLEKKNELGLEIHSGRNRIVRRIFESLGYEVEKLDRVMYAGLTKKNLPRSKWRFLDEREIVLLKHFKS